MRQLTFRKQITQWLKKFGEWFKSDLVPIRPHCGCENSYT